ncbi:MAG: arylamine N-acetyltransferase [Lachnospiraceae bacterium]|nr:arylamine N-acetyltransferase [Lachnospiraceae bacterium]
MFEELYSPLPDREAYLNRIGAGAGPCSLESLDELILAHQKAVPFENLDPYYTKKTLSCAIDDLFDKIVTRKRGGYCFEQNALFVSLLQSLGYSAWSSHARIIRGKDPASPILILHRVNLVALADGLYFCDVGYGGPMPPFAIKVADRSCRTCNGETFYIRKQTDNWWLLGRITSQGVEEDILLFQTEQVENCDFFVLNHYASTSPLSVFTNVRLVNRKLDTGNVSITGDQLTIHENGSEQIIPITDNAHLRSILEEYFAMDPESLDCIPMENDTCH